MINCSRGATLQNRANGGYFRGKARGCRESPSANLTAAAWLRWPAVTGCLDGFVVRIEVGFQHQNGGDAAGYVHHVSCFIGCQRAA